MTFSDLRALLIGVLVAWAVPALAQDRIERAREHYERGKQYYEQKQYDLALDELMKAYVLDPQPELVYNIGRVHEDRGTIEDAIRFFENYLKLAPRAANRRDVKRRIRKLKVALKNRPPPGYLTVQTKPPGATIRLNGRIVGVSPLVRMPVQPARYQLEIDLENYEIYRGEVLVSTSMTTTVDKALADAPSNVFISTVPPGAEAVLTSPEPRTLGACPCVAELPAGTYEMQVTAPGHVAKELKFVKRAGETLKLNVTLVPQQTTGELMVDATVSGAEVRVDGTALGRTPLQAPLTIRPGTVEIEVVASGHRPWRGRTEIRTGELTRVSAILDPLPQTATPVSVTDQNGGSGKLAGAGWALTGVGIGLLVGGGLLTTFAHLDEREFNNGTYWDIGDGTLLRSEITRQRALELKERAEGLEIGAIVGYSVGGAALITGIILLALDEPEAEGFALQASPIPGGGVVGVSLPFQ